MHIFCLNLGRHDSEYCCEEFRRNLSLPSHVRYIFLKCVVQLFAVKSFHSGNNFSRDSLFRSRRIARENMCETQKNVSLFFNTQLLIWRTSSAQQKYTLQGARFLWNRVSRTIPTKTGPSRYFTTLRMTLRKAEWYLNCMRRIAKKQCIQQKLNSYWWNVASPTHSEHWRAPKINL